MENLILGKIMLGKYNKVALIIFTTCLPQHTHFPQEAEAEKNPDYGSLYYMDGQKLENKTEAEDSNPYYKQL